jgi:hypothetical protein
LVAADARYEATAGRVDDHIVNANVLVEVTFGED